MIGIKLSSIGVTLMRFRRALATGWSSFRSSESMTRLQTTAGTTTAAAE